MGQDLLCYIPKSTEIGPLVSKKKLFKAFYHIWAWKPSGHVTNIIITRFHSLYLKAYIQNLVKTGQVVSKKTKF